MHTGHQAAYFYMFTLPYLLQYLFQAVHLTDPKLRKSTYNVFICKSPWRWPLSGRIAHSVPKYLRGKKKPSVHLRIEANIK